MAVVKIPAQPLRLTDPYTTGPLVRAVQHALRNTGIEQDGVYGPESASVVAQWQWRDGAYYHRGAVAPAELEVLLGRRRRDQAWLRRRRERVGKPNPTPIPLVHQVLIRPRLEIVERDVWLPFPPAGRSVVSHYAGIGHVVHWFGPGTAAETRAAGVAQCVGFARYHRFTLGWADLGYNFAILRDGSGDRLCTVLEGRGDNVRGAHSGHNVANAQPGVLVLCGTGTPRPTDAQLRTLQELRRVKKWGRRTGHLEWSATSCPGPVLTPWVLSHR
jgi:hypothetical protein